MQILKRFLRWVNLPYVSRKLTGQLELGNTTQLNSFNITNVVNTRSINSIVIPRYLAGRIEAAYLDLMLPYVYNYNVATNSLDDADGNGSIQVKSFSGGTWTDAIYMIDQSMATPASTVITRGRVAGSLDVATQIGIAAGTATPNNYIEIQWKNNKAHLDGFTIRQLQAILRIWVR